MACTCSGSWFAHCSVYPRCRRTARWPDDDPLRRGQARSGPRRSRCRTSPRPCSRTRSAGKQHAVHGAPSRSSRPTRAARCLSRRTPGEVAQLRKPIFDGQDGFLNLIERPHGEGVDRTCRPASARLAMAVAHNDRLSRQREMHLAAKAPSGVQRFSTHDRSPCYAAAAQQTAPAQAARVDFYPTGMPPRDMPFRATLRMCRPRRPARTRADRLPVCTHPRRATSSGAGLPMRAVGFSSAQPTRQQASMSLLKAVDGDVL